MLGALVGQREQLRCAFIIALTCGTIAGCMSEGNGGALANSGYEQPSRGGDGATTENGTVPATTDAHNANAGAPQLSLITPPSALQGTATLTLTVAGSGFDSNAVVKFAGQAVPSQLLSATTLSATLGTAQLAQKGSFPVTVSMRGADSNAINFTVVGVDSSVRLTNLSPAHVTQYAADTTLTVSGSGFTNGARVLFNGGALATTFVSSSQVTAVLPNARLSTTGTFPITVDVGNSPSMPISLTIDARLDPTLTSASPSVIFVGAGDTSITVKGANYDASTRVAVYSPPYPDGEALTPTDFSATQARVTVPAYHLTQSGTLRVRVYNLLADGNGLYASGTQNISLL